MTVTVDVEVLEKMQKEIERLQMELKRMTRSVEGFEKLDTDGYLTEVYNS
ncbi:MAG: hypothetical protein H0Z33_00760 [Bacillaceae bacterium]|nr:hypothetical protein [Bacillaceae bacterium]